MKKMRTDTAENNFSKNSFNDSRIDSKFLRFFSKYRK